MSKRKREVEVDVLAPDPAGFEPDEKDILPDQSVFSPELKNGEVDVLAPDSEAFTPEQDSILPDEEIFKLMESENPDRYNAVATPNPNDDRYESIKLAEVKGIPRQHHQLFLEQNPRVQQIKEDWAKFTENNFTTFPSR